MTKPKIYDIVLIGAGPSGCASAYHLAKSGFTLAIIEKNTFPLDKICGEALSADVVNQFYRMDSSLGEAFLKLDFKKASNGIRFYAPNHTNLDISFTKQKNKNTAGFIMKRLDFDTRRC